MMFYNDFNSMFNAHSGVKGDVGVFNLFDLGKETVIADTRPDHRFGRIYGRFVRSEVFPRDGSPSAEMQKFVMLVSGWCRLMSTINGNPLRVVSFNADCVSLSRDLTDDEAESLKRNIEDQLRNGALS